MQILDEIKIKMDYGTSGINVEIKQHNPDYSK
jgi:hypothetical protein